MKGKQLSKKILTVFMLAIVISNISYPLAATAKTLDINLGGLTPNNDLVDVSESNTTSNVASNNNLLNVDGNEAMNFKSGNDVGLFSGNAYYQGVDYQLTDPSLIDHSDGKYYVLKGENIRKVVGGKGPGTPVYSTTPSDVVDKSELCPYLKGQHIQGENLPANTSRKECDYASDAAPELLTSNPNISDIYIYYYDLLDSNNNTVDWGLSFNEVGTYKVYYELAYKDVMGTIHQTGIKDYLTVEVVDDTQFIALDDTTLDLNTAPTSQEALIAVLKPKMVEVEEIIDRAGNSHLGEEITNVENFIITSSGRYSYNHPSEGQYTIKIRGTSPTTGLDVYTECELYIVDSSKETVIDGDLLVDTPIRNTGTDALEQANPIAVLFENSNLINATKENSVFSVVQQDKKFSGSTMNNFYLLESTVNGKSYQNIVEMQKVPAGTPNAITIESIEDMKLLINSYFDPIIVTNTHVYDDLGQELPAKTLYNNVDVTQEGDYQVIIEVTNNEYIAHKLVDVHIVPGVPGGVPILVASDSEIETGAIIKTEEELLDLFNIKAIDIDDADLVENVEVFSTGGYVYGQPVDGDYKIVVGYTFPSGITMTSQRTLYSVTSTQLESVELNGNSPVYVKKDSGLPEIEVSALIDPEIVVYSNFEVIYTTTNNIKQVYTDGYNTTKEGVYHFVYTGVYDSPSSGNNLEVSNVFDVNVNSDINTSYVPIEIIIPEEDVKVEQGSYFDPIITPNVTASSIEDGDVTPSVVVLSNEVNTDVVGQYPVTYYVQDSVGNNTTKTIMVDVYNEYTDFDGDESSSIVEGNKNTNTDSSNSNGNSVNNGNSNTSSSKNNHEGETLVNTTDGIVETENGSEAETTTSADEDLIDTSKTSFFELIILMLAFLILGYKITKRE